MADDTTQRAAFKFIRERLQSQEPFTLDEFSEATGWEKPGTVNTYLRKQYKGLFEKVGDDKYRVSEAFRKFVTWGSLCILSFEGRKHWGSRIAVSFPRATGRMAASDRQSYRIALKIRTADLPGRIRDHLLGRQHPAVDECADEMMTDAGVFGRIAHRHPLLAIHRWSIGADARGTARLFDAGNGPRLALSGAQTHAIQGGRHQCV
jgi:hypothetical protein